MESEFVKIEKLIFKLVLKNSYSLSGPPLIIPRSISTSGFCFRKTNLSYETSSILQFSFNSFAISLISSTEKPAGFPESFMYSYG